jgi:DNA polymerase-3 subunit beta
MKFTINREQLVKPLQQVASVVEKRQTLPVLSNVLVEVKDQQLILTGTDMEIEMVARLSLEGQTENGLITAPARKLLDICKSLPADAQLEIQVTGDKFGLKSGRGRYSLATLPAADFPSLEGEMVGTVFALPPAELRDLIDKTAFSMAQQDVRYYLNGMLLELTKTGLRSVTTDGHRLALADMTLATPAADAGQIILPRKGVMELMRLLSETGENVDVTISRNHLRVATPHYVFTSKLVDGKFPEYDRVIPKKNVAKAVVDKESLRQALSRVLVLSNEKYRGVRLQFSSGSLALQANNPEQEEAEEEVSINYQGEFLEIGFNIVYLLDILGNVSGDKVVMELGDGNSSALLFDESNSKAVYVVMPMRL